jgi:hypothetical protein
MKEGETKQTRTDTNKLTENQLINMYIYKDSELLTLLTVKLDIRFDHISVEAIL